MLQNNYFENILNKYLKPMKEPQRALKEFKIQLKKLFLKETIVYYWKLSNDAINLCSNGQKEYW